MKRTLALLLLTAMSTFGQSARLTQDPWISSRQGNPVAGATIAVCQPLATTAASVTSNIAVFTMASNPITAGFVQGMTAQIAGFTGADTYFNNGTLSGGTLTGGLPILSVTASTIVVSLVHGNASATSNGTVLQMGNAATSCAGLSTIYTDASLVTTTTNPLLADGLGNYGAGVTPGIYYVQVYGSGIVTTMRQVAAAYTPSTGNLVPIIVADINLFTQAASISQTTLYTVPASGTGLYRVSCYTDVTQAATNSSTLPTCSVRWTDADSNTTQNTDVTGTSTGNALGNQGTLPTTSSLSNVAIISPKAATTILYLANSYATNGATPMQYSFRIRLEYLGQ